MPRSNAVRSAAYHCGSTRAALTYLHGNGERQHKIASNLDVFTRHELAEGRPKH